MAGRATWNFPFSRQQLSRRGLYPERTRRGMFGIIRAADFSDSVGVGFRQDRANFR